MREEQSVSEDYTPNERSIPLLYYRGPGGYGVRSKHPLWRVRRI
jgi:hypothetical protein